MKDANFFVIDVDQRRSRRGPDRVSAALAALRDVPTALGFERTAGDEFQGLLELPEAVVACVSALARFDLDVPSAQRPAWRIGVGIGPVDDAAVASTREARGGAYLAARRAIDGAKTTDGALRVEAASGAAAAHARLAEDALVLLRMVLQRRSADGWEAVELLAALSRQSEVAARLGVSTSAVSQRLSAGLWREAERAEELAVHHLRLAQQGPA